MNIEQFQQALLEKGIALSPQQLDQELATRLLLRTVLYLSPPHPPHAVVQPS